MKPISPYVTLLISLLLDKNHICVYIYFKTAVVKFWLTVKREHTDI